MSTRYFLCAIFLFTLPLAATEPIGCDIFDPTCRLRLQQEQISVTKRRAKDCDFQDIWLIPGRADASCTRTDGKKLIDIDPRQVSIRPPVVRFPGCFTIEIKNVRIHDNDVLGQSLFAKSEYQWINVKEFGEAKCQNSSSNGCGGFGNNCFYCDICESLKGIDTSTSSSTLAEQFRGLNCPRRPGYYTFRKEFCFNDWSTFDADDDCRIDFLNSEKSDVKSALSSLQQIGYGTVVAKIRLALNATGAIEQKKVIKERQIEDTVLRELEERRKTWDINRGQFDKFQQWYIDYRKNIWHREEYLPWLLYENEISCLRLTFDVCERVPRQRPYGSQGYTCD
ncbi:hypothetical protein Ddc_18335 [Ditylenchus destructor]|nr:hypothetical protein Ddc_18335 [Ditylenchus destructor]